jgi:hypothetical protein
MAGLDVKGPASSVGGTALVDTSPLPQGPAADKATVPSAAGADVRAGDEYVKEGQEKVTSGLEQLTPTNLTNGIAPVRGAGKPATGKPLAYPLQDHPLAGDARYHELEVALPKGGTIAGAFEVLVASLPPGAYDGYLHELDKAPRSDLGKTYGAWLAEGGRVDSDGQRKLFLRALCLSHSLGIGSDQKTWQAGYGGELKGMVPREGVTPSGVDPTKMQPGDELVIPLFEGGLNFRKLERGGDDEPPPPTDRGQDPQPQLSGTPTVEGAGPGEPLPTERMVSYLYRLTSRKDAAFGNSDCFAPQDYFVGLPLDKAVHHGPYFDGQTLADYLKTADSPRVYDASINVSGSGEVTLSFSLTVNGRSEPMGFELKGDEALAYLRTHTLKNGDGKGPVSLSPIEGPGQPCVFVDFYGSRFGDALRLTADALPRGTRATFQNAFAPTSGLNPNPTAGMQEMLKTLDNVRKLEAQGTLPKGTYDAVQSQARDMLAAQGLTKLDLTPKADDSFTGRGQFLAAARALFERAQK